MTRKPFANPIAARELKARMRSSRSSAFLTAYMAIMGGIALLFYAGAALGGAANAIGNATQVGADLFYVTVGLLTVLVSFIAPLFTVGAISGERERHSYDLLKASLLTSRQIAIGKLLPAQSYVLLLVLITIPLFSLSFLLGGVEAGQLAAALCTIVCSALLFTTLGLFASSRMPTTLGAVTVTYAVVLGLVIGLAIVALMAFPVLNATLSGGRSSGSQPGADVLLVVFFLAISLSPISAMAATEIGFQNGGSILTLAIRVSGAAPIVMPAPIVILCVVYLIATAALLGLSIRNLNRN